MGLSPGPAEALLLNDVLQKTACPGLWLRDAPDEQKSVPETIGVFAMKRVSLLCVAAAAAAIMVPSARADLFNISFNGGPVGFSGSGVFNALNDGGGVFTVQGVLSGTVTDPFSGNSSITAVSSFAGADNELFFPSTTYFDLNGLSFNLTNGLSVNLFFDGFSENELRSDGEAELVSVTVTPAATPEPSSFVLLGSAALLGAGDLLRRRRTAAS